MEEDLKKEDELEWSLRTLADKQFPMTQIPKKDDSATKAIEFLKNMSFKKPEKAPSEDQKKKILEEYEHELKQLFESNTEKLEDSSVKPTPDHIAEKQAEKEFPLTPKLPPPTADEVRRSMQLSYNAHMDTSPLANASDVLSKDDFRILEALINQYKRDK